MWVKEGGSRVPVGVWGIHIFFEAPSKHPVVYGQICQEGDELQNQKTSPKRRHASTSSRGVRGPVIHKSLGVAQNSSLLAFLPQTRQNKMVATPPFLAGGETPKLKPTPQCIDSFLPPLFPLLAGFYTSTPGNLIPPPQAAGF